MSNKASSNNPTRKDVVIKSPGNLNNSALKALSVYCDSSSSEDETYVSGDELESSAVDVNSKISCVSDNKTCSSVNTFNLSTISSEEANVTEKLEVNTIAQSNKVTGVTDNETCNVSAIGSEETDDDDDDSVTSSSTSSISDTSYEALVLSNDSELSDDDSSDCLRRRKIDLPQKVITRGELTLDDLPPIEDLCVSVEQEKCVLLGNISSIVDKLVVVQGLQNLPPVDLDTVLFLEPNKPLGVVFDVIGPVIEPVYCVRFNSSEQIKEKEVAIGKEVFFVPTSNHTKYVFLAHLMRMKGSDASWEDNNEPPPECLDYSDDEQERAALRRLKLERRQIKDEDVNSVIESLPPNEICNTQRKTNGRQDGCVRKNRLGRRNHHNSQIQTPLFVIPSHSRSECTTPLHYQLLTNSPHPQFPNVVPPQQVLSPMRNTFPVNTSVPPPPVNLNMSIPPPPPFVPINNTSSVPTPLPTTCMSSTRPGIPHQFGTPPPAVVNYNTLPFYCNTPPPPFSQNHQFNNNESTTFPSPAISSSNLPSFPPPQSNFSFTNIQTPPYLPPSQISGSHASSFNQWRGSMH